MNGRTGSVTALTSRWSFSRSFSFMMPMALPKDFSSSWSRKGARKRSSSSGASSQVCRYWWYRSTCFFASLTSLTVGARAAACSALVKGPPSWWNHVLVPKWCLKYAPDSWATTCRRGSMRGMRVLLVEGWGGRGRHRVRRIPGFDNRGCTATIRRLRTGPWLRVVSFLVARARGSGSAGPSGAGCRRRVRAREPGIGLRGGLSGKAAGLRGSCAGAGCMPVAEALDAPDEDLGC